MRLKSEVDADIQRSVKGVLKEDIEKKVDLKETNHSRAVTKADRNSDTLDELKSEGSRDQLFVTHLISIRIPYLPLII